MYLIVLYCIALYCVVLHCIVLYLYSIVFYCIVLYCIVLYLYLYCIALIRKVCIIWYTVLYLHSIFNYFSSYFRFSLKSRRPRISVVFALLLVFSLPIITIIIANIKQRGLLDSNIVQIGFILLLAVPSTAFFTGFSILSNTSEEIEKIHKKMSIIDSPEILNGGKLFVEGHQSVLDENDINDENNDIDHNFIEEEEEGESSFENSPIAADMKEKCINKNRRISVFNVNTTRRTDNSSDSATDENSNHSCNVDNNDNNNDNNNNNNNNNDDNDKNNSVNDNIRQCNTKNSDNNSKNPNIDGSNDKMSHNIDSNKNLKEYNNNNHEKKNDENFVENINEIKSLPERDVWPNYPLLVRRSPSSASQIVLANNKKLISYLQPLLIHSNEKVNSKIDFSNDDIFSSSSSSINPSSPPIDSLPLPLPLSPSLSQPLPESTKTTKTTDSHGKSGTTDSAEKSFSLPEYLSPFCTEIPLR